MGEKLNANYLIKEAGALNRNNDITMYLVGTNPEKRASDLNKEDVLKFADEYKMTFVELNVQDTNACDQLMKNAICEVCRNMDSGRFKRDDSKPPKEVWNKYGIMINGDRNIIDNPPQSKAPEQPKPKVVEQPKPPV